MRWRYVSGSNTRFFIDRSYGARGVKADLFIAVFFL